VLLRALSFTESFWSVTESFGVLLKALGFYWKLQSATGSIEFHWKLWSVTKTLLNLRLSLRHTFKVLC